MKRNKPLIGILDGCHSGSGILPVYLTTAHYPEAVAAAGAVPVQLPMLPDATDEMLQTLIASCDGFLLPGGADFESKWYGEHLLPGLAPDTGALDVKTQETALRFIRMAAVSGKPILGICLGIQVLNVALGGSLVQDIPMQRPSNVNHRGPMNCIEDRWQIAHTVRTEPGSRIRSLCGEETGVNSFHHQALKTVAPGLKVTAWAPDGIPEAVESENGMLLAVQWHPENLAHAGIPEAKNIFHWLAETAFRAMNQE